MESPPAKNRPVPVPSSPGLLAVLLIAGSLPAKSALIDIGAFLSDIDVLPSRYSPIGEEVVYWRDWEEPSANIDCRDNSAFHLESGSVRWLLGRDASRIIVTGGSVEVSLTGSGQSVVTLSGGSVRLGQCYGQSLFRMEGGRVSGYFNGAGSGTISMTGGEVEGAFFLEDSSSLHMSGGTLGGEIWLREGATVTLYGQDFGSLEAGTYRLGDFTETSSDWFVYRLLTVPVKWQDGSTQLLRINGAASPSVSPWSGTLNLIAVPEASTGVLMLVAGLAVWRRTKGARNGW